MLGLMSAMKTVNNGNIAPSPFGLSASKPSSPKTITTPSYIPFKDTTTNANDEENDLNDSDDEGSYSDCSEYSQDLRTLHPAMTAALTAGAELTLSSVTIMLYDKVSTSRNFILQTLKPLIKRVILVNETEEAIKEINLYNMDPNATKNSIKFIIASLDVVSLRIVEHVEKRLKDEKLRRMEIIPILLTVDKHVLDAIKNNISNPTVDMLAQALEMHVVCGYIPNNADAEDIVDVTSSLLRKYAGVFAAYNDLRKSKSELGYPKYVGDLENEGKKETVSSVISPRESGMLQSGILRRRLSQDETTQKKLLQTLNRGKGGTKQQQEAPRPRVGIAERNLRPRLYCEEVSTNACGTSRRNSIVRNAAGFFVNDPAVLQTSTNANATKNTGDLFVGGVAATSGGASTTPDTKSTRKCSRKNRRKSSSSEAVVSEVRPAVGKQIISSEMSPFVIKERPVIGLPRTSAGLEKQRVQKLRYFMLAQQAAAVTKTSAGFERLSTGTEKIRALDNHKVFKVAFGGNDVDDGQFVSESSGGNLSDTASLNNDKKIEKEEITTKLVSKFAMMLQAKVAKKRNDQIQSSLLSSSDQTKGGLDESILKGGENEKMHILTQEENVSNNKTLFVKTISTASVKSVQRPTSAPQHRTATPVGTLRSDTSKNITTSTAAPMNSNSKVNNNNNNFTKMSTNTLHMSQVALAAVVQKKSVITIREILQEAKASPPDMLQYDLIEIKPSRFSLGPAAFFLKTGYQLQQSKEYTEAQKFYAKAVKCDQFNIEAWYCHGVTCDKVGNFMEALSDFSQCLKLSRTVSSKMQMDKLLIVNKEEVERNGSDKGDRSGNNNSNNIKSSKNLRPASASAVRFGECGENKNSSINQNNSNTITSTYSGDTAISSRHDVTLPRIYINRALVYIHLGDDESALEDLSSALKYDQKDTIARGARAMLYRRLGDFVNSQRDYIRIEQIKRDEDQARVTIELINPISSSSSSQSAPSLLGAASCDVGVEGKIGKSSASMLESGVSISHPNTALASGRSSPEFRLPATPFEIQAEAKDIGRQLGKITNAKLDAAERENRNQRRQARGGQLGGGLSSINVTPPTSPVKSSSNVFFGSTSTMIHPNMRSTIDSDSEESDIGKSDSENSDEDVDEDGNSYESGDEENDKNANKFDDSIADSEGNVVRNCGKMKIRDKKKNRSVTNAAPVPIVDLKDFKDRIGLENKDIYDHIFSVPTELQKALCVPPEQRTFLEVDIIVKQLRGIELTETYPQEILEKLAKACEYRIVSKNYYVSMQGELPEALHICLSGSIQIKMRDASQAITNTGKIQAGEYFGDYALLFKGASKDTKIFDSSTVLDDKEKEKLKVSKEKGGKDGKFVCATLNNQQQQQQQKGGKDSLNTTTTTTTTTTTATNLRPPSSLNNNNLNGCNGDDDDPDANILDVSPLRESYFCETNVELILIMKNEFNLYLRDAALSQQREKFLILKRSRIFEHWTTDAMVRLSRFGRLITIPRGKKVIEQGSRCESMYFIFRGVCIVSKYPDRIAQLMREKTILEKDLHYSRLHHCYHRSLKQHISSSESSERRKFMKNGMIASGQMKIDDGKGVFIEKHHVTNGEVAQLELEKKIRDCDEWIAKFRKEEKINQSNSTDKFGKEKVSKVIETLTAPSFFGAESIIDTVNGLAMGSVTTDISTVALVLHKVQIQAFDVTQQFLDSINRRSTTYPDDIKLAKVISENKNWGAYKEFTVSEIDKKKWPVGKKYGTMLVNLGNGRTVVERNLEK